jgi:hypothetical protein
VGWPACWVHGYLLGVVLPLENLAATATPVSPAGASFLGGEPVRVSVDDLTPILLQGEIVRRGVLIDYHQGRLVLSDRRRMLRVGFAAETCALDKGYDIESVYAPT